jgi:sodium/hydrogen antiporter
MNSDWFRVETAESHFQDVIDLLLNLAVFVYLGTIMPWSSFNEDALGLSYWRLTSVAILILLFRRLPIVMAFFKIIPALKTRREGIKLFSLLIILKFRTKIYFVLAK